MIKAENIGKEYSIGARPVFDLRSSLKNKMSGMFSSGKSEKFWAVQGVSFELEKGDAMGIIGRNGSGKSTLLKVLSRITEPTTGRFEVTGRVSSLLEVGTGFHVELTGRENIYLNGTILGMKRAEVREKFEQIVEFSGVADFIETPIKHYSSGMKVRLAFAVAAHLEPEILIIDEVLAVGDAEFQQKCLGKMGEVTKEGRTVLFVSHNIEAVTNLCNKGMVLNEGKMQYKGSAEDAVNNYLGMLRTSSEVVERHFEDHARNNRARITKVGFNTDKPTPNYSYDDKIACWFEFQTKVVVEGPELIITLFHGDKKVAIFFSRELNVERPSDDRYLVSMELPVGILNNGNYYISLFLQDKHGKALDRKPDSLSFNILNKHPRFGPFDINDPGLINMPLGE